MNTAHPTHVLGFPRLGPNREYKKALESYWNKAIDQLELQRIGAMIRQNNWRIQSEAGLDFVTVGDFAWYDHVLNTSLLVGAIPKRFNTNKEADIDTLFRMARGRAPSGEDARPCEMTKWFNTNYHYLVPELNAKQEFHLGYAPLFNEVEEAKQCGHRPKVVLLGPLSYLWLARCDGADFNKLDLLERLVDTYAQILTELARGQVGWVQMDEPILALDLPSEWQHAFDNAYSRFTQIDIQLLLSSYFGSFKQNAKAVVNLPVAGLHLDATTDDDWFATISQCPTDKVLSLGIIDGKNIWRADLNRCFKQLQSVVATHKKLWIASSCSLLHVPLDLEKETQLDSEVSRWLAFATQKCREVALLGQALTGKKDQKAFADSDQVAQLRQISTRIHKESVIKRTASITKDMLRRHSPYPKRAQIQYEQLDLPLFPTTTIGSFPQTKSIRTLRSQFKAGVLDKLDYQEAMQSEIKAIVNRQEKIGLDVLVHGEPERNDMVEYFGELLDGMMVTSAGWVQSYGSRCVKPPIVYGDISRPDSMTVSWSSYAQSCTKKPVKAMLTGPVTILCWSFVRDDIARADVARQIGLALRDEVIDLEDAGMRIIQIDEPALREGLPLRRCNWEEYLIWAVEGFRLVSSGVADTTQIHSHMCYSEFNDIISSIAALDADVISIECSRSNMKLLDVFDLFDYPNAIGPGVYDIHSPLVPAVEQMKTLLVKAASKIPAKRLWVNPDCGLKTRDWKETEEALANMVRAANAMR